MSYSFLSESAQITTNNHKYTCKCEEKPYKNIQGTQTNTKPEMDIQIHCFFFFFLGRNPNTLLTRSKCQMRRCKSFSQCKGCYWCGKQTCSTHCHTDTSKCCSKETIQEMIYLFPSIHCLYQFIHVHSCRMSRKKMRENIYSFLVQSLNYQYKTTQHFPT